MKGLFYILLLISMLFNTASANNLDNYITDMDCHMSMTIHEGMDMHNEIDKELSEECCECENCNMCIVNISYITNLISHHTYKQNEQYSYSSSKKLNKKYLLYRPPKLV